MKDLDEQWRGDESYSLGKPDLGNIIFCSLLVMKIVMSGDGCHS